MKAIVKTKFIKITLVLGLMLGAGGCAIFEGTEAWCDLMEQRDKTDWTLNDAKIYGQECLIED